MSLITNICSDRIWFGILLLGLAFTILDEKYDTCMKLTRLAYIAFTLVNDLYLWKRSGRKLKTRARIMYLMLSW